MENNWHSETKKRFSQLPIESLEYIRDDARQAAKAGETFGNPKAGQYWDEYWYACDEIARRSS